MDEGTATGIRTNGLRQQDICVNSLLRASSIASVPAVQLITEKHAAEIIATPPGTLRYWRHQGKGPNYVRLGGRIKYDLAEVIAFVDRHRHTFSVRASIGEKNGNL